MVNHITEGIIIRIRDSKEKDRIVTLYTLKYGKLVVYAKGVRKPGSKMGPFLNLMSEVEIMFIKGRNTNRLAGISNIKNFFEIAKIKPSDILWRIGLGEYYLEVLDNLIKEGVPDEKIFKMLEEALGANFSGKISSKQAFIITKAFVIKILSDLGYKIVTDRCLVCHKPTKMPESTKGEVFFVDYLKGGVVHQHCLGQNSKYEKIDGEDIENLQKFENLSLHELSGRELSNERIRKMSRLADNFLKIHIDADLKTLKWLSKLGR